jgi:hypothetical protein
MDAAALDVLPLRACPRIYICYVLTPGLPASAASSLVYFPKKKTLEMELHFSSISAWMLVGFI